MATSATHSFKIGHPPHTANISAVKITVFQRVPFPAVIPLYYLHLITALSTVEKCKHRFTVVYYKIYTFTW